MPKRQGNPAKMSLPYESTANTAEKEEIMRCFVRSAPHAALLFFVFMLLFVFASTAQASNLVGSDNPDQADTDGDGRVDSRDPVNIEIRYLDKIQKLYIAYYLRPADPSGLYWWARQLKNNNADMAAIIESFANSEESIRLWGEINPGNIANVIDTVYQGLFHRPADEAGKEYYVDGFLKDRFTAGSIVLDILQGAQGEDAQTVSNKLDYCNTFISVLDPDGDYEGPFEVDYGIDNAHLARDLLADVTAETGSLSKESVQEDVLYYLESDNPLKIIQFKSVSATGEYDKYLWMGVPQSADNYYIIKNVRYDPQPETVYTDSYGNKVARWDTENTPAKNYTITCNYRKIGHDQQRLADAQVKPYSGSDPNIQQFLEPSAYVQSDSAVLQNALANEVLEADNLTTREKLENILAWTMNNVTYGPGKKDALSVYTKRQTDCGGYANLIVAFARMIGVPARQVSGVKRLDPKVYRFGAENETYSLYTHCWLELYFEGAGWVQCESTLFSASSYTLEAAATLPEERIILGKAQVRIGEKMVDWLHIPWIGPNTSENRQGEDDPMEFYMEVAIDDAGPALP